MPVKACTQDGDPGFKWGDSGKCYTYPAGDDKAKAAAKKLAVKQAIAIGGGKLFSEAALETVDLTGVEIMAADVRVFGEGAVPDGGEVYTTELLQKIADDTNEVADEMRAPNKLGHSTRQRLLAASGILDEEERPAAGWLTNTRVEGEKLLTDIKKVPKKVADLIEAGAFRVRSPEIGPYTSQETGKSYGAVVRGLAWLGTSPPAFKTLDDVYALYSGADRDPSTVDLIHADRPLDTDDVAAVAYFADGESGLLTNPGSATGGSGGSTATASTSGRRIVWDPAQSAQAIMDEVRVKLNPGPPSDQPSRYWVMDLSADRTKCLVSDYSEGNNVAWVVPLVADEDGDLGPAPSDQWVLAEQAWVASATTAYEEAAAARRDTTNRMPVDPDTKTKPEGDKPEALTPDEVGVLARVAKFFTAKDDGDETKISLDEAALKAFAEAAGVPDETDPAKILAAVTETKAKAEEPKPADVPEGMKLMSESDLGELKALAQKGADADDKIREVERVAYFTEQTRAGRLDPADYEHYQKVYDQDPDFARTVIEKLPARAEVAAAALGAEGDENDLSGQMDEDTYRAYCDATGIPYIARDAREGAAA